MRKHILKITNEKAILEAMSFTSEIANRLNVQKQDILFMRLATEEACTNALEYCQKTGQSSFDMCWCINNNKLVICLSHKGEKFEVIKQTDVNVGLRGRGLQLIINLMDCVRIEQHGEYVSFYMEKFLDEIQIGKER